MFMPAETLRILLVEDNPGDQELVRLYMAQALASPIELSCVESLGAARQVIDPSRLDLVLLDLGLPDGRGLEVVDRMRSMAADVPIVVLTGSGTLESGLDALERDAQDYLVKDQLSPAMLSRSVRYAVHRRRWQNQYRHQLSVSPDGILVLDSKEIILFSNSSAVAMLGHAPTDGGSLPDLIRGARSAPVDVTLGTGRVVEVRSVETDWQGRPGRLITLRDMTERREAERALSRLTEELRRTNRRLEELVSTDPLTGILNRRGLEEALGREIERLARTGDQLVAILVDMDDFKSVNDSYGHAVGDAALKAMTSSLREALRGGDQLGRVGGDEFLVLLSGTTTAEGVAVAEKLRRAVKATRLPVADGSVALAASFAVGVVPPDVVSIEQVLASVGSMLKRSKDDGKNRVSSERGSSGSKGDQWAESELNPDGIDLHVALQSIRCTTTNDVVGNEALTRGPPGAFANPADLFRAAFEQNVLTTLDLRALSNSLALLRATDPDGTYHVNLFPSTVLNTPTERIIQLLTDGVAAGRLCVELSEQQFLGDPSYLREPLLALRKHGVRVAIDDVGFGRSSIEALLVLEPDVVKVDRRCLHGIEAMGERRQLERLMAMLSAVNAEVIVEGVETEAELSILRDMGVILAQGFLWGRPARG